MPGRSFKQIIHWQDGDVLIIETQDEKDNLLHFYYENKTDLLSISLNENRHFLIADILPHQLRFKSRYEENRIRALKEFGIISRQVAYHVRADNHVFLRIGNLESGHYALINPKNYELNSLHNRIWLEDGSSIELKILFKKYVTYRWQEYAKVTEYYFDNKRPKQPVRRVISEIMHDPAVEYEGLQQTDVECTCSNSRVSSMQSKINREKVCASAPVTRVIGATITNLQKLIVLPKEVDVNVAANQLVTGPGIAYDTKVISISSDRKQITISKMARLTFNGNVDISFWKPVVEVGDKDYNTFCAGNGNTVDGECLC